MRWFKLRLLCRDEAKGPVTAVCGMDGYLVSSMGQKVCQVDYKTFCFFSQHLVRSSFAHWILTSVSWESPS